MPETLPSITTISLYQALDVWADLEDAYRGEHVYGGRVAEIYAYRLMSYSPLLHLEGETASRRAEGHARIALATLVEQFCARRECTATIAGATPVHWRLSGKFDHRVHVEIRRAF